MLTAFVVKRFSTNSEIKLHNGNAKNELFFCAYNFALAVVLVALAAKIQYLLERDRI